MKATDERPNSIPWPPIILISGIVISSVINAYFPLRLASGPAGEILQGAGLISGLLAILIYLLSIREMRKRDTTVVPTKAAGHLVTSGPFAVSRNPIYLANVLLLIGWGLLAANGWMILAAFICGYAEQKLAIEREEAHLEHKFGKAWRDYRKRVRRWI